MYSTRTPRRSRWLCAFALLLTTAGCGGSNSSSPSDAGKSSNQGSSAKPKILFITNGNSDWWSAVEKGMKDGAEKFGAQAEMRRNNGQREGQIRLLEDALSRSDVAGAVALFAGASREAYQDQLTALAGAGALPRIAADLGPIRLIRVHDRAAEYELRAVQQGTSYSFYVLFVVDTDGVWRLRVF